MSTNERTTWDRHWQALEGGGASLFGRLASLVRRTILCRAVRHYSDRWFPAAGVLVEAGCGTGQASERMRELDRCVVGFDFSLSALLAAREGQRPHQFLVCGDIHALPFRDGSLAGIWNLGVMEHFPPAEGREILQEMARALHPGACAVLFWPPEHGLSRLVLGPIEWLRSRLSGKPFRFFPDEVHRLTSRRHARQVLGEAGLTPVAADFTPRDAFIHIVAVGRKPAA